jgi:phage gp36-like protein
MAYASVEEIKSIIGEDRLASFVSTDEDLDNLIDRAIKAQSAELDVYLTRLYDVPFDVSNLTEEQQDNLNAMLKSWLISMVLNAIIPQGSSGVPEGIKVAYDRTMSRLRDLILGKYQLPYVKGRRIPHFLVVGETENVIDEDIFSASRVF